MFEVILTPRAEEDLYDYAAFIALDNPDAAEEWADSVLKECELLSQMPHRFAVIAESELLGEDLRSFPFHSHRVVYWVDSEGKKVFVIRIYHMARRPLRKQDLK